MADKKIAEQYYSPPVKMGKWEGFRTFLWNSETSQCLGRTGTSWAKILLFYIIFYAALAGFFGAMLAVFFTTLQTDKPKWMMDDGLIGSNPGLGFRPMPPEENVESTLIWYEASKEDNYKYWVEETGRFLKTYDDLPKHNQVQCSFEKPPPPGKVCASHPEEYAPCTLENNFGFHQARPCIFLKLNKIYNWNPEVYNDSKTLPPHMPEELKQHITEKEKLRPLETNVVWVSCEGENPADVEHIKARDYYPRMGFPRFYFPFVNVAGYIPPIVAVQFTVETPMARTIASSIVGIIERIRDQMACGFDKFGIPSLAPLKIGHKNIGIHTASVKVDGEVNAAILRGLEDFQVTEMKVNIILGRVSLELVWNAVSIESSYHLEAILKHWGFTVDVVGKGDLSLSLVNIKVKGTVKYSLGLSGFKLKQVKLVTTIGEVDSNIRGILGNGLINDKLNDIIEETILIVVNDYQNFIADKLDSFIVSTVNNALHGKSMSDISATIGGEGGSGARAAKCGGN